MLNIVIPMAGRGSRFADAGFTTPKPLITIHGVPMIERVIRNLTPSCKHQFIFVCQSEHLREYRLASKLEELSPGCKIVSLYGVTDGAACSVLAAHKFIDNENPLMIANSDQLVDICIDDYLNQMHQHSLDGLVMTMPSQDPKWSYVKFDKTGWISSIVEKEVVSNEATVGIYNFRQGKHFCKFARLMIERNERSFGEFYVAPVYSDLYNNGFRRVGAYNIKDKMYGLGTPDDLAVFLKSHSVDGFINHCR